MAQLYSKTVAGGLKVKFRTTFLLIMSIAMQNGQLQKVQMRDREDQPPSYYDDLWRYLASDILLPILLVIHVFKV